MKATPEDKIEKQFEFEKQLDRSAGLLGFIGFIVVGSVALWLMGLPFGLIVVSDVVLGGIGWLYIEWDREKRRADAQKRRADALASHATGGNASGGSV